MSAQLFHPSSNSIARFSIFAGALIVAGLGLGIYMYIGSDFYSRVRDPLTQPVPFSHQRHVGANGLDCRYCHTSVEESAFAGIPPTETCMTCHSQILSDAPIMDPIHTSWETGQPIEWVRVHDLPDYTYFNHSVHISKGVGCSSCHGDVSEMRLTWREETLQMDWCLECHRQPEKFVRPLDEIYNPSYEYPANQHEIGHELVAEYGIKTEQLTNCSICHR